MRTARTTSTANLIWRKSTYSGNGAECVEVSDDFKSDGLVPVRDSKRKSGPNLVFADTSWSAFVHSGYARKIVN
ncbi:DUF397 domain-containing protein [Streptomyces sp. NPDC052396]|uniref:DUF397 domain-containing protein n=1 Tax=Streptomyces sp. NPDC052396 TaxID=3365689 RepID=UPI0037D45F03